MKKINNYEDALKIGKKYIEEEQSVKESYTNENDTSLPFEIKSKKWNMSLSALKNTLTYLFEKLHHPCYMLCIKNNKFVIYKLVMSDASPTFVEAIKTRQLPILKKNKLLTEEQKDFIINKLGDLSKVRILQCILKEQTDTIDTDSIYEKVLAGMKLPNGVFILNLTDAVILKNDGTEPFPMVTGKLSLGKYNFNDYIPIMSMSGENGYRDIPIPNYDDIEIAMSDKLSEFKKFTTNWNDKTINQAVFRGGPSGCGYTPETNMRIKLALMKSKYLNVGIVSSGNTIDSKSIKFDPKYGLGMLNTGIKPVGRLTMDEQSKYKYIIHIDGNVNAYRLLTTMCTGSLVLRVNSEYRSWVDHLIQPGVHYLKIKHDLSDLESKIEWCLKNDAKCKEVAKNGLEFAMSVLQKDFMKTYFQKILWSVSNYSQRKTHSPDGPPKFTHSPDGPPKFTHSPDGPPKFIPHSPDGPPKFPHSPDGPPKFIPHSPDGPPKFIPHSPDGPPKFPHSPDGPPKFIPHSPDGPPKFTHSPDGPPKFTHSPDGPPKFIPHSPDGPPKFTHSPHGPPPKFLPRTPEGSPPPENKMTKKKFLKKILKGRGYTKKRKYKKFTSKKKRNNNTRKR